MAKCNALIQIQSSFDYRTGKTKDDRKKENHNNNDNKYNIDRFTIYSQTVEVQQSEMGNNVTYRIVVFLQNLWISSSFDSILIISFILSHSSVCFQFIQYSIAMCKSFKSSFEYKSDGLIRSSLIQIINYMPFTLIFKQDKWMTIMDCLLFLF